MGIAQRAWAWGFVYGLFVYLYMGYIGILLVPSGLTKSTEHPSTRVVVLKAL